MSTGSILAGLKLSLLVISQSASYHRGRKWRGECVGDVEEESVQRIREIDGVNECPSSRSRVQDANAPFTHLRIQVVEVTRAFIQAQEMKQPLKSKETRGIIVGCNKIGRLLKMVTMRSTRNVGDSTPCAKLVRYTCKPYSLVNKDPARCELVDMTWY